MNKREMQVVLVHAYDPAAPGQGGYPRYVQCLLEGLLDRQIETTLLGIQVGSEQFVHPGFTFVPLLRFDEPTVPFWSFWRKLMLEIPRLQIPESAIIHIHHPYFVIPFSIFCRQNRKVCTLHGGLPPHYRSYLCMRERLLWPVHKMMTGHCLTRVEWLLPVGRNVLKSCVDTFGWGEEKASIVPVPVDLHKFRLMDRRHARLRHNLGAEARIVVYVGRLEFGKQKRVDLLIRAFKRVSERLAPALLVLVGDGADRGRLQHLAESLDVDGVVFMGEQPADKIPELLNAADLFALPSAWESGPFVIKEALACGIAVVATAVGDVPQLISNNEVGRIVQGDEEAFGEAIVEVLYAVQDPDTVRDACRERVIQFSTDRFVHSVVKVYEHLCGR